MKALRITLIAIVALLIVLVVAVGAALMIIDPNDYKGRIEQAAASNTNLELALNGEIEWSLLPLGLSVTDVKASLDNEPFVALDELVASVDLWSLLQMAPAVNTFQLDGFQAQLTVDEDGTGNWTRVMPEGAAPESGPGDMDSGQTETPASTGAGASQRSTADAGGQVIAFNVQQVRITNARLSFEDRQSGQSFQLSNARLEASDIALGKAFPLELGFSASLDEPKLAVDGSLAMQLRAGQQLEQFDLDSLDGEFNLGGAPFNGQTVSAGLSGSAAANLTKETASVSDLAATLENAAITANLRVQGFSGTPRINGDVSLAEFSPRALLKRLGQPAITTRDDDVLTEAGFDTTLATQDGMLRFQDTRIHLDETEFNGEIGYGLDDGALLVDLQGNRLNLDRYLPPEPQEPASDGTTQDTGEQAAPNEGELLPLEALRKLSLDIQVGLGELVASKLTLTDLAAQVTGSQGQLSLDELSANLYGGRFNMTGALDARGDTPEWRFDKELSGVNSQPLLMDLASMDLLSGAINVSASGSSQGNSTQALLENSDGKASFRIDEGAIENINMTRMACKGISRVHGESLSTDDWGESTPFNDMSGHFSINSGVLRNDNLTADLAGLRLEGDGMVDLIQSMLDYRVGLHVVGEVHRDQACRVNERVQKVVIPVRCQGGFGDDPANFCGFDGERFGDVLESMAQEAIDQKKDEAEEKARERVEEEIKERVDKKTRDRIRNLFE
ncbi:AsmA family protein [Halomonadaceae bacterium KBTZ08]